MSAKTFSQVYPQAPKVPHAEIRPSMTNLARLSEPYKITVIGARVWKGRIEPHGWYCWLHTTFMVAQNLLSSKLRQTLSALNDLLAATFGGALVATLVATAAGANGAHAASVAGQGTWETTLQARDMNHDGVTDAFYDTLLKVTWLRDATANGATSWDLANRWANTLVVGGLSGWRLPTMIDTGAPHCDYSFSGVTDCGFNVQTISGDGKTVYSEMAHLWYDTLGNKSFCALGDRTCSPGVDQPGAGLTNTGDFQNLRPNGFWTGVQLSPESDGVWYFGTGTGIQATTASNSLLFAMAVRTGDVAAIPEPQTLALMAAGLVGIVAVRGRRRN